MKLLGLLSARRPQRLALAATLAATITSAAIIVADLDEPDHVVAASCAPGYVAVPEVLREIAREMATEHEEESEQEEGASQAEFTREVLRELPMLQHVPQDEWGAYCVPRKRPESLRELSRLALDRAIPRVAPFGAYRQGAFRSAADQRAKMRPGSVPGTAGKGAPYGHGPLIVNDARYDEVNGLGLGHNSARVDSFAYDPEHDRLFTALGTGGIWMSENKAASWTDATGNLPTTITGAVGWTSAGGGTLLALTGEPTFGSYAYTGIGAYYSTDLGKTWTRAEGVPDGALGFAIAVDSADPDRVYAATQFGLFVSTDAGRSYANAKLPTGDCAGVTEMGAHPECAVANVVTDVVVVEPGGVNTTTPESTVVATVGWRGSNKANPDGSVQSPNNGVYRSPSGDPGSFEKLAVTGLAEQARIGRVELGTTVGEGQDHDILYAIVQDAKLLNNGGIGGIDVPEGTTSSPVGTTVLNGLYVSRDFGSTWTKLASGTQLATDPTTGSALFGYGTAVGYQPGVQGWYNLWIQPDPTRQTASGAPTRLVFGLEEMWANESTQYASVALDGTVPVKFRVIGKYFGGQTCSFLNLGGAVCPTDREPFDDNFTTHPDQQDGVWIVDPSVRGGVQLIVGNDGGVYRYRFETDADGELDNSHWGLGDNDGFESLLPYFATMAEDGTVWAGLQDNGTMRIAPPDSDLAYERGKKFETIGGDGFFTAVDPKDSDIAYEEYTAGVMRATTDGGETWNSIDPDLTAAKFSNPFAMDPYDAKHLLTAGREVVETTHGPDTATGHSGAGNAWTEVFNLGTRFKPGDPDATATAVDPHNSMSAVDVVGDYAYVGFCGQCDTLNKVAPSGEPVFMNGLATNVGGEKLPEKGTSNGWHLAEAKGLPNRYITSVAIDPADPDTVFVALGGYTRRWLPPGAVGDVNAMVGEGHLYRSTDAGKTFTDVTGNLPDVPVTWVELRGGQLLVGTDLGAFASSPRGTKEDSPTFAPLADLPAVPIASIQLKPGAPDTLVIAAFGRGVWTYKFDKRIELPSPPPPPPVLEIGKEFVSYDFDADAQGWSTVGTPTWTRGAPGEKDGKDDASGSAYSITGAMYTDLANAALTSPAFETEEGTALIEWAMKLDTEGGYDYVHVDWSTDGSSWTEAASFSGRNKTYPDWSTYRVPFESPGGPVQVRFRFTSDEICSGLGGPVCVSPEGWEGVHADSVRIGEAVESDSNSGSNENGGNGPTSTTPPPTTSTTTSTPTPDQAQGAPTPTAVLGPEVEAATTSSKAKRTTADAPTSTATYSNDGEDEDTASVVHPTAKAPNQSNAERTSSESSRPLILPILLIGVAAFFGWRLYRVMSRETKRSRTKQ